VGDDELTTGIDGVSPGGESGNPLAPLIDLSSAFAFPDSKALARTHRSKHLSPRYGRDTASTQLGLEKRLELDFPGFRALAFSSGMSAIEAVFQIGWRRFDTVMVSSEIYRKTEKILASLQELRSRNIFRLPVNDTEDKLIPTQDHPVFAFVENPTNPHLRLIDTKKSRKAAGPDSLLVADLSLSGYDNLEPGQADVLDILVFSLTKYIGGHNDLLGGVLLVRPRLYEALWEWRSQAGTILGPLEAYLTLRSLKTFSIRWAAHQARADLVVTALLERHQSGDIAELYYPGVGSNTDQSSLADELLRDRGAVVSFVVPVGRDELADRVRHLQVFKLAPSFGSVDSLVEISSLMSQPDSSFEDLELSGLEPTLVRASLGLEPVDRILSDLHLLISGP
jgi:cystathionine beta-lyase/cystathionine gamma-synthase